MNTPADPTTSPSASGPRPRPRRRLHVGGAVLVLALIPLVVKSLEVDGALKVGNPASTHTVVSGSAAVGANNSVVGFNTMAIGELNQVYGQAGNFAVGKNNWVNGYSGAAFGENNSILSDSSGGNFRSMAWGHGNTIQQGAYYATAGGRLNIVGSYGGMALGTSLTNYSQHAFVVGRWNAPVNNEAAQTASTNNWRGADSLFVVGNGSADNNRSNALVVQKNGNVTIPGSADIGKVPNKGGISMGDFTAE